MLQPTHQSKPTGTLSWCCDFTVWHNNKELAWMHMGCKPQDLKKTDLHYSFSRSSLSGQPQTAKPACKPPNPYLLVAKSFCIQVEGALV